jgi:membrane protease YdiL (CAAX protease family)
MLQSLFDSIVQLIIFSFIPLIWWLITARKKENFFTWLGWKRPVFEGSIWKILGLALAVCVVYIFLSALVMTQLLSNLDFATTQYSGEGFGRLPEIFLFAFIKTSMSEEILFRGFLCKRLSNKIGFLFGNSVQAVIFGLLHGLPIGLASGNILVFVIMTLLPGGIGWFSGWVNEKKSKGSILPSYLLHALMNLAVGISSAMSTV